jgi:hypothetical protein
MEPFLEVRVAIEQGLGVFVSFTYLGEFSGDPGELRLELVKVGDAPLRLLAQGAPSPARMSCSRVAITAPERTLTTPRSGSSRSVSRLNKVVFPAPLRPTSATRQRSSICH